MASVPEEEQGSTRIKSELHDHTDLPLRYASLERVYSVSSSSSSSSNKVKAVQLTVTDAPTHPRPEIVRVYSRRRRRLPDKEERMKRRRIGNSELMNLGVDSTTTLSVSTTLRGCRINNANKQNGSSKRKKKLLQASPSAKKWIRLSYDGVDPTTFIGLQCKVFWPLDADWYTGSIIGYNVENKHHTIKYGDGDVEELALRREMIVI